MSDVIDGTIKPNRAMRRTKSPASGKRRTLFNIDPLRYLDLACTKRRPWTIKAESRAAARRAKAARKANRP